MNRFTLSNGLNVIYRQSNENPIVTIQFLLKNGASCETKDKAGVTNLSQVLMFKGTASRSNEQLGIDLENIGASVYLDSDHDFSNLGISATRARIDKAAEILADIMINPSFIPEEIEKERANILAGIKARQDNIHQTADDLMLKTLYKGHPYSWPDIGLAESVKKFTRQDIVDWHNANITAGNLTAVMIGDLTLDEARQLFDKYFSALPVSKTPIVPNSDVRPHFDKVFEKSSKFQQAYFMVGFPAPSIDGNDYPALKVLNAMLGGRMSGRLFTELREKLSLAYEVNSYYPSRRYTSRFVMYLGLSPKNLSIAKKRMFELIDELKKDGVTEKELAETKNYIKGVYLLDHQTIARQAWWLGWWDVMGKTGDYDDKYLDDLNKVTAADIKNAANKYFGKDYVQVEIAPAGKGK